MLALTAKEWEDLGYIPRANAKPIDRNEKKESLFTRDQVEPVDNSNYRSDR